MSNLDIGITLWERSSETLACGISNSFCDVEKGCNSPSKGSVTDQDEIDCFDLMLLTKDLQKMQDERELHLSIAAKAAEEVQCCIRKARLEALKDPTHCETNLPLSGQMEVQNRETEEEAPEIVIVSSPNSKVCDLPEFSVYRPGKGDLYDNVDTYKGTSGLSVASPALAWHEKITYIL